MSIQKEKQTVEKMIRLYCRLNHKQKKLCPRCEALLSYTHKRLEACRYGNQKPTCRKCTTHCYAKPQRDDIKKVMRFAGPRILIYQPLTYIKHLFK